MPVIKKKKTAEEEIADIDREMASLRAQYEAEEGQGITNIPEDNTVVSTIAGDAQTPTEEAISREQNRQIVTPTGESLDVPFDEKRQYREDAFAPKGEEAPWYNPARYGRAIYKDPNDVAKYIRNLGIIAYVGDKGNIWYKSPNTGKLTPLDSEDFTANDMADMVTATILNPGATIGSSVGTVLGGSRGHPLLGSAALSGIGAGFDEMLQRRVRSVAGVPEENSYLETMGLTAGSDLAAGSAFAGLRGIGEYLAKKGVDITDKAREAYDLALQKIMGNDPNKMNILENFSPYMKENFDRFMGKAGEGPLDEQSMGRVLMDSFKEVSDAISETHNRGLYPKLFKEVDATIKISPDSSILSLSGMEDRIANMRKYDTGGSSLGNVVDEIKKISNSGERVNLEKLHDWRKTINYLVHGKDSPTSNVKDIGNKIISAIDSDIDVLSVEHKRATGKPIDVSKAYKSITGSYSKWLKKLHPEASSNDTWRIVANKVHPENVSARYLDPKNPSLMQELSKTIQTKPSLKRGFMEIPIDGDILDVLDEVKTSGNAETWRKYKATVINNIRKASEVIAAEDDVQFGGAIHPNYFRKAMSQFNAATKGLFFDNADLDVIDDAITISKLFRDMKTGRDVGFKTRMLGLAGLGGTYAAGGGPALAHGARELTEKAVRGPDLGELVFTPDIISKMMKSDWKKHPIRKMLREYVKEPIGRGIGLGVIGGEKFKIKDVLRQQIVDKFSKEFILKLDSREKVSKKGNERDERTRDFITNSTGR